jgi:hypothetical protein
MPDYICVYIFMATIRTRDQDVAPTVCRRSSAKLTPKPGVQGNLTWQTWQQDS